MEPDQVRLGGAAQVHVYFVESFTPDQLIQQGQMKGGLHRIAKHLTGKSFADRLITITFHPNGVCQQGQRLNFAYGVLPTRKSTPITDDVRLLTLP